MRAARLFQLGCDHGDGAACANLGAHAASLGSRPNESNSVSVPARVWQLAAAEAEAESGSGSEPRRWFARPTKDAALVAPDWIAPSSAKSEWPDLTAQAIGEITALVYKLRPEALVEASDRLRGFVDERWPGAVWHREVEVVARVDTRRATAASRGSSTSCSRRQAAT